MTELEIAVRLNQQQLELLDRTVAEQDGAGRSDLIAQALREYYDAHFGPGNK
jgi:Predicted transcriptional regulators containing the CopG/Arc/MetJ DNA-binding domain and a metal-binding domain